MVKNILFLSIFAVFSLKAGEWISDLQFTPNPSPYVSDWESNPGVLTFTLTYTGFNTISVKLRASLKRNGTEIANGESEPINFTSPATNVYSNNNLIDWNNVNYSSTLEEQIVRSGRFPDGNYSLCVSVIDISTDDSMSGDCETFRILLPSPPSLLSPAEAETTAIPFPVFVWTPIIGPPNYNITYRFSLWEVHPGQTPLQATYGIPHYQDSTENIPTLIYPIDAPLLENGKTYVWQVQALDLAHNGFGQNQGKSNLFTFTFSSASIPSPGLGDTLEIVENAAYLIVTGLEVTDLGDSYRLNGNSTLLLPAIPGAAPINVQVTNLLVQKSDLSIVGGSFNAHNIADGIIPQSVTGPFFKVTSVSYNSDLRLGVRFSMPSSYGVPDFDFPEGLTIDRNGLHGTLSKAAGYGENLFSFGSGLATLDMNEINAHFSNPVVSFSGRIHLFDTSFAYSLDTLTLLDGEVSGKLRATGPITFPIVPDQNFVTLTMDSINGDYSSREYSLTLFGNVSLNFEKDTCGGALELLVNQDGASLQNFEPSCELPAIDLSWMKIDFSNLTLPQFSFGSGHWNFNFNLDAKFSFPSLDSITFPWVHGISIFNGGFRFPEFNFPTFSPVPHFNFGGFDMKVLSFSMPEFTLPSFSWPFGGGNDSSGFNFNFGLGFSMPNLPGSFPDCIRAQTINLDNVHFIDGGMSFDIPEGVVSDCHIPLGGGVEYVIEGLGGSFQATYHDSLEVEGGIDLRGSIVLPEEFSCNNRTLSLGNQKLHLSSDGLITGTVENVVPSCPLQFGPLTIQIDSSGFTFVNDSGAQRVNMGLHGVVKLPAPSDGDSITASGNMTFELTQFEFIDGFVRITEPFIWNLPSVNPVLAIRVDSATLDTAGFHINGNGALQLSDGFSVGVNFNSLVLNLSDFTIKSGSADFSGSFAFKVDLAGPETWSAVQAGAPLTGDGILLNLPDNLSLNDSGLTVHDTSLVRLKWNGTDYSAVARFSDNFALSWSPHFGVSSGQVDFIFNGNRVAWLDTAGFHPDFGGIVPIPAKLPIPDTSIAFVQLKQNDTLLVSYSYIGDTLRIFTKPNKPVRVYVPSLKMNDFVPNMGVEFDVKVNPESFEFYDGEIQATPPEGADTLFSLDALGIPLDINVFKYMKVGTGYVAMLGGRLAFPASLDSLNIEFDSLRLSASGLAGTARVGHVFDTLGNRSYVDSVRFGNFMTFKIDGGEISFSPNSARFSGDIYPDLFERNGTAFPIHFVANYGNSGFDFNFDMPDTLPISYINFIPMALQGNPPISISLTDTISVELAGIFSFPFAGDSFSISMSGLKIMNVAPYVVAPEISYPTTGQFFKLFGLDFGLRDVRKLGVTYPALGFEFQNGIFKVNMSGEFAFMRDTISFTGLKVGSDGSFEFQEVNLLSSPINIVDHYWTLDTVKFTMDSLRIEGSVILPAPFDTVGKQRYSASISYDGTIRGGGKIVLIDETPAMDDDPTEFNFFVGSLDINYLAVNLDLTDFENSGIDAVFYLYFDAEHPVKIGYNEGDSLAPGFSINLDGDFDWGDIDIPAGSIPDIDWNVFKLSIGNVTLLHDNSFGVSFSGSMQLNVSSVSGNIEFQDFEVSSDGGVEFPTINRADLSIAGVMTMSIASINYVDHDTTIQVPMVGLPTANNQGSSSMRSVNVSSSFSFGLTLNIMDYGGGGVKNFIAYTKQSDGSVGMVIDSANMVIPSVFEASFDMEFESGEYFRFLFAGDAKLPAANNLSVALVGKLANTPTGPSFGAFVTVSTQIDIIPRLIILSGLGGGFFYNPEETDFRIVKAKSGLTGMPFDTMTVRNADFSIFLYAEAEIVTDWVARGRALLTVTDQEFLLDAKVVLLHQDDKITGYAHLGIGFQDFYAVGNIGVDVNVLSLIKGQGTFGFFVYNEDAWGITGGTNMKILSFIDLESEFFVGPPGFMVSGTASYGFDIWIIEVNTGFEGQMWYIRDASWGAYYKAYVEVEVLGGAAGAKGWLESCLIGSPNFYLYGAAGLEVHALFISWEGSAWAKISGDGVDGGFGHDPEMDALIDEARQSADDMNQAKEEAQAAMDEARATLSNLSPAEQANIFYKVFTHEFKINGVNLYDYLYRVELANGGLEAIEKPSLMWVGGRIYSGYYSPYRDTNNIVTERRRLNQAITRISQYRGRVDAILERINLVVDSINSAGLTSIGASPVEDARLGEGHLHVTIQNGKATVTSQPGFAINASQASQNATNAIQYEHEAQETYAQVISRMNDIEIALFDLKNLMSRGSIDSLLKAYSRADIISSKYYGYTKQYFVNMKDWAKNQKVALANHRQSIRDEIHHKTNRLTTNHAALRNLVLKRKLAELTILYNNNVQDIDTAYATFVAWFNDNQDIMEQIANNTGMEIWYTIPDNGLSYLDSLYGAFADSLDRQYLASFDSIRAPHIMVTQAFDNIYTVSVELGEVLYDLYDRFIFWLSGSTPSLDMGANFGNRQFIGGNLRPGQLNMPDSTQRHFVFKPRVTGKIGGHVLKHGQKFNVHRIQLQIPGLSNYDDGINTFRARIDTLGLLLTPPRITTMNLRSVNRDHYNRIFVTWNVSHPLGRDAVKEVSYMLVDPNIAYNVQKFQSMGAPSSGAGLFTNTLNYSLYQFQNRDVINYRLCIRARGGLGLTTRRCIAFPANFAHGGNGPGHSRDFTAGQDTTPPLPPVISFPRYSRRRITPNTFTQNYYTAATTELYAEWRSQDYETGVEEYQYMLEREYTERLLNPFGGTYVLINARDTLITWTSAQGLTRKTIRGLSLKHDSTYILSVRARNVDGYWSNPGHIMVTIDTTPPPAPARRTVLFKPLVYAPVFGGYIPPSVTVEYVIKNDPESGISRFLYKVDTLPHHVFEGDGWKDVPGYIDSIRVVGGPLTYLDTFYISVFAVNSAGLLSDSGYVSPPLRPDDPTPPEGLHIQVTSPTGGHRYISPGDTVTVTLIHPAEDRETGVKSYLIGMGSTQTRSSLMRFAPVDPSKVRGNSFKFIPNFSTIRDGMNVYFLMRAVNNDGDTSRIFVSPHIRAEKSPPPAAHIRRVSYRDDPKHKRFKGLLDFDFYITNDRQSNTVAVYYRVVQIGAMHHNRVISDWQRIPDFGQGLNNKIAHLPRALTNGSRYILEIKTVNGVGMVTVSSRMF